MRVEHLLAELDRLTEKLSGMLEKKQENLRKGALAFGTLISTETRRFTRALSAKACENSGFESVMLISRTVIKDFSVEFKLN